ncbi:hypothetical protein ETB97_005363 [Aspergillus alliaceus]|uniref:LipA and NB-ARC domain protein n=1 Tax=Petromyces alliaceus TaxID=209559 RepID=A0A8H6ADF5_PETAA|nr:hypothetical protein ETB97_005363 [Aspergillus burnettii]
MSAHLPIKRKPLVLPPQETGVIRPTPPRPRSSNGKTSPHPVPPPLRPTTSNGRPSELYPTPTSTPPPPYYYDYPPSPNVPPIPQSATPTPQTHLRPPLHTALSTPSLRTHKSTPNLRPPPRSTTDLPAPAPAPNAIQKAYGEVSHFLGGLIAHPTESTRHHTILRHSHGIVFYRGPPTSIAISIFSDTPLPADRTYYLQSRGWTGKTGMRAKALFRLTDDWLDVTPSFALRPNQVEPGDERAWQRDINKFRKKAPSKLLSHKLRETVVARIPAEAGDGYFQLNLCQNGKKKKVLCSSPVFRVLSTSLDPSSLRGASLSTMPLEVGAMVLGMYAQTAARAAVNPVTAKVSNKLAGYKPSAVKQTAVKTVYSASGMEESVNRMRARHAHGPSSNEAESSAGEVQEHQQAATLEMGPQHPFPMDFKARAQPHVHTERDPVDAPRYTLVRVPDTVLDRLRGYFLAWTRFDLDQSPPTQTQTPYTPTSPYTPYHPQTPTYQAFSPKPKTEPQAQKSHWYPTIISLHPLDPTHQTRVNLSQAMQKTTTLRFLDEVHLPPLAKVQVRVMCFLRADIPPPSPSGMTEKDLLAAREAAAEAEMLADTCDVDYAQALLDHPAWGPEGSGGSDRQGSWVGRTAEGMENARMRAEKMVDKVPLHWIGVRSPSAEVRDRQVEVNGFYIVRG